MKYLLGNESIATNYQNPIVNSFLYLTLNIFFLSTPFNSVVANMKWIPCFALIPCDVCGGYSLMQYRADAGMTS